MDKDMNKPKISNSLKYGSIATVLSVVFIVAVLVINGIFAYVADLYGLKIDMTVEKRYSLSEESINLLRDISKDIKFIVMSDEASFESGSSYLQMVNETLKTLRANSGGKISIEYIDPNKNPAFFSKYELTQTLSQGTVIVESDIRFKAIPITDMYVFSSDNSYLAGLKAEQSLVSAMLYVLNESLPKAAFISGHGEMKLAQFEKLLASNNYEVTSVYLPTEEIPDDVDIVIVATPLSDFGSEEIKRLDKYFDNFGNAIFMFGYGLPDMPNLSTYLEEWGIRAATNALLLDEIRMNYYGAIVPIFNTSLYMFEGIDVSKGYLMSEYTCPIEMLWPTGSYNSRYTNSVLYTSAYGYTKVVGEGEVLSDISKTSDDKTGVFNVAVKSSTYNYVGEQMREANLLFIGSPYRAADNIMAESTFLNSAFFTAVLNDFNYETQSIYIPSKDFTTGPLSIIGSEQTALLVFIFALPLIIVGLGLFVWIRRKNR